MTLACILRRRLTQVTCLVAASLVLSGSDQGVVSEPGGPIPCIGGDWYLNGANYPWLHYGSDFGGNGWGAYGVHDRMTRAAVDADFARMQRQGIRAVRWWLFSDGRAGIRWDRNGMPTGLDEYVYPDMDSALALARKHHLYLELVLVDFLLMSKARYVNGVQLGGRTAVINTVMGQQALVNKVFKPVFERYGRSRQIIAYDVMNEPEQVIREDTSTSATTEQPASLASLQRFVRDVAATIHVYSQSYVTLGSSALRYARQWEGLGLDFYSIHYYDAMRTSSDVDLYSKDYRTLKLGAPVVVGEYPPGGKTASFRQYLDNWFYRGYAGALVWSFRGVDAVGAANGGVMASWNSAHSSTTEIQAQGKDLTRSRSVCARLASTP